MLFYKKLYIILFYTIFSNIISAKNILENITLNFTNTSLCAGSNYNIAFTSSLPNGTLHKVVLLKNNIEVASFFGTSSPININLSNSLLYGNDYALKVVNMDGTIQSNLLENIVIGIIGINSNIYNQDAHFLQGNKQVCTGALVPLEATIYKNNEKITQGVSFQWQKDNVNIGINENPIYANENGSYKVVVSQGGCVKSADNVTLAFGNSIQNNTDLENALAFCEDGQTKISAQYRSTTASYQWKLNGNDIPGETERSLIPKTTGDYQVAIIDKTCSSTSNPVQIKLSTSLFSDIISQNGTTLCGGNFIQLVSGFSNQLYIQRADNYGVTAQWQKNGIDISNEKSFNMGATTPGIYRLKLKQGSCESFSNEISIVNGTQLEKPILFSPTSKYPPICSGSYFLAWFTSSNAKIYKDDLFVSNGSTINATTSGIYKVVVGQGTSCENASDPLTISIGTELIPTISTPRTMLCGSNDIAYLSFDFVGNGTMAYQWQKNQTDMPGITSNGFGVHSTNLGTYRVKVTNGNCESYSNEISIVRNDTGPYNIKTFLGYDYNSLNCTNKLAYLTFEIGSMGYKWYKNGVEIPNENKNRLTTPEAGTYTATATGNGCLATSNPYIIASDYVLPPTIQQLPAQVGSQVTLNASGCTGEINWYLASTGGSSLGSGPSFTTPALNISQPYFADCSTNNCKSYRARIDISLNGCTILSTLKSGSWYDPTIWSCGRIPQAEDTVTINNSHTVELKYGDAIIKMLNHSGNLTLKNTAKLIFQN